MRARARVPCPARNKPPPVSGARCRTPRTGTTSDGATRVYFCCESGHRTLYRGRRCRCSSRWRRWRCCTACKASSRPMSDHATRQIAPQTESTARLVLTPRDPTRREDFSFGASRERHRRCLLRSAMDRPRKRARGPAPTRPFANFASPRVLNLATRVPKRASPSPAPRAPAHAAPSGVDVVTRIKRVSQAYPEWCRTPKTCCRVTRGSRTSNLTNQTAS